MLKSSYATAPVILSLRAKDSLKNITTSVARTHGVTPRERKIFNQYIAYAHGLGRNIEVRKAYTGCLIKTKKQPSK